MIARTETMVPARARLTDPTAAESYWLAPIWEAHPAKTAITGSIRAITNFFILLPPHDKVVLLLSAFYIIYRLLFVNAGLLPNEVNCYILTDKINLNGKTNLTGKLKCQKEPRL